MSGSALTYYNSIPVNPAGRYLLFATDGLPNCGGGDPNVASDADTVAAMTALRTAEIKTFVLGFGMFGGGGASLTQAAHQFALASSGVLYTLT